MSSSSLHRENATSFRRGSSTQAHTENSTQKAPGPTCLLNSKLGIECVCSSTTASKKQLRHRNSLSKKHLDYLLRYLSRIFIFNEQIFCSDYVKNLLIPENLRTICCQCWHESTKPKNVIICTHKRGIWVKAVKCQKSTVSKQAINK